ncbi:VIR protein [Plasmodium vivax]|uniref:VIR protein n=1 Tax=Plasmodium vivax TaxID=5855 RepID=A0A1G4ED72_PLAVI|nr:VIR protein [Plasmodium vivax]
MDSIPFFKDLIDAVNKVNEQIKVGKCTLKFDKNVTLDELIKRKISYIYFKKYNDIKGNIKPEKKDEKDAKLKELEVMVSHYLDCFWVDHPLEHQVLEVLHCRSTYNPKDLLPKVQECKPNKPASTGFTFFGLLSGSPSSRISTTRSVTIAKETPRAAGSEGKNPGSSKNPLPDVPPKDKGAKEVTKDTVSVDRSKGLPRPEVEAGVRNSGVAGAGLSGQVGTLQPRISSSPPPGSIPGQGVHTGRAYAPEVATNTVPVPIVDSTDPLESVSDKVDSNFYRNIIMGVAIIGTIFFLFYYNMSSGLKSRFPKRKRKKKIFEHNYYEEYEKELAKYESENESLDSQSDRYYLNYQPERDYDY